MAAYNLEQLDFTFTKAGYAQSTRTEVEAYLLNQGYFTSAHPTVDFETSASPAANVEVLSGSGSISVTTDTALSEIVDATSQLTIAGSRNIGVSLTSGEQLLVLQDSGNDVVYGGLGNDVIDATRAKGNVTLHFGSGHDTILGGTGHDTLSATAGALSGELISGSHVGGYNILSDSSSTAHTLQGGAGADSLSASGAGNDLLISGSVARGFNILNDTGLGNDTLVSGAGNDSLYAAGGGHDTLYGGTGHDQLTALAGSGGGELVSGSLATGYNVLSDTSLTDHTMIGGAGNDSIYASGSGNDVLISGSGSNLLDASKSAGDNLLRAVNGGNDTLLASLGADTLDGSANTGLLSFNSNAAGSSTMLGGSGVDTFHIDNTAIGSAGSNNHTIDITLGKSSPLDYVGFQNRESGDASSISEQTTGGVTTYTVSFHDGQTVNVSGGVGSGTSVDLIFTDTTIMKTF
jgi:Ca2+-binding RTX toxin-like protein